MDTYTAVLRCSIVATPGLWYFWVAVMHAHTTNWTSSFPSQKGNYKWPSQKYLCLCCNLSIYNSIPPLVPELYLVNTKSNSPKAPAACNISLHYIPARSLGPFPNSRKNQGSKMLQSSYIFFRSHKSSYTLTSRILEKEAPNMNQFDSFQTLTLVVTHQLHTVHHSRPYWLNPKAHLAFICVFHMNSETGALIELKNDMCFTVSLFLVGRTTSIFTSTSRLQRNQLIFGSSSLHELTIHPTLLALRFEKTGSIFHWALCVCFHFSQTQLREHNVR